jgi:hypothetical protein
MMVLYILLDECEGIIYGYLKYYIDYYTERGK